MTQRAYAGQGKQPHEYIVGNSVWLSAKNICTKRAPKKLEYKFYGTFPVTKRIGKQAYRLMLKDLVGRIHPVFQISLREPHLPGIQASTKELRAQLEVECKGQKRLIEDIGDSCVRSQEQQYLVKWKAFREEGEYMEANCAPGP